MGKNMFTPIEKVINGYNYSIVAQSSGQVAYIYNDDGQLKGSIQFEKRYDDKFNVYSIYDLDMNRLETSGSFTKLLNCIDTLIN